MTKTRSFERGIFILLSFGVLFFFLEVPMAHLIFWPTFLAVSVFATSYIVKAERSKAYIFSVYSFYLGVIELIIGIVGFSYEWALAASLTITAALVIIVNFVAYCILTAPLITD